MKLSPLFRSNERHPLLVTPDADDSCAGFRDYALAHRDDLRRLLLRHGAMLFRGFRLEGAKDFQSCVESLGARPFGYVGGDSPRRSVAADVYTSTEYPASETIPLHHEMSYLPAWPRRLFFYCALPAASGGQTALASSRDVLGAMPEHVVRAFRSKRVEYIRHFHAAVPLGKSWQATYQVDEPSELESILLAQGSTCSRLSAGVLRVSTPCDGLVTHPETGEEVWFNQAEQWHASALKAAVRRTFEALVGVGQLPHECRHGDGDPLAEEALADVRRALENCKLLFDWQKNDLLMLDNVLMMHGREPFKGDRKILAYLSAS
jgi:alpha-ketoglutarate-dependent taurine dioxygenase